MQSRVEFHPATQVASYVLGGSFTVILALLGLKQLIRADRAASTPTTTTAIVQTSVDAEFSEPTGGLLIPIVELQIPDVALEATWSSALASAVSGQVEYAVEHGRRVDVITQSYAIEIDHFDKWHEAIGQAAHYGAETSKIPVVALMFPMDLWPISETTREKLLKIDSICAEQRIKLILLRRLKF
jgi:hypothetical protein